MISYFLSLIYRFFYSFLFSFKIETIIIIYFIITFQTIYYKLFQSIWQTQRLPSAFLIRTTALILNSLRLRLNAFLPITPSSKKSIFSNALTTKMVSPTRCSSFISTTATTVYSICFLKSSSSATSILLTARALTALKVFPSKLSGKFLHTSPRTNPILFHASSLMTKLYPLASSYPNKF
jgi:hypothetical protein